jgi:hypothetical protein
VKKWIMLGAALVALSGGDAFANGTGTNVTIVHLFTEIQLGNFVLIQVSPAPTGQPACETNGEWNFVLPLSDNTAQQTLAMLLSARATGATVTIGGLGTCSNISSIEDIGALLY